MTPEIKESDARREFLKTWGRFAGVTPPALVMLLSTSLTSNAVGASTGRSGKGNNGEEYSDRERRSIESALRRVS